MLRGGSVSFEGYSAPNIASYGFGYSSFGIVLGEYNNPPDAGYIFHNWDTSFNSTKFLGFTLTPALGYEATVTSAEIRSGVMNGTGQVQTEYSLNSTNGVDGNWFGFGTSFTPDGSNQVLTPSSPITVTASQTIFLRAFMTSNTTSTQWYLFNDGTNPNQYAVSINGSVQAVPEPGSIILTSLALAGSAGVGFFRRRKVKSEAESTEPTSVV